MTDPHTNTAHPIDENLPVEPDKHDAALEETTQPQTHVEHEVMHTDPEYPIHPENPQHVTKQPALNRQDGNRWIITGIVTLAITAIGFFFLFPVNSALAITGLMINIGLYLLLLIIRFSTRWGRPRLYGLAWLVAAMWVVIIICLIIGLILV